MITTKSRQQYSSNSNNENKNEIQNVSLIKIYTELQDMFGDSLLTFNPRPPDSFYFI